MQSLLADVVDYWATGDGDPQSSRTDMEAALCQALLCADKQIIERSAVVTHDPLPAVTGDFEVLTKVLHHLIGNAIEYCVAPLRGFTFHPNGWISIGCSRWRTMVLVSSPHSKAESSRLSSACTGKNTPGTDWDWHSARRPSSGMAAECGWSRRPARDRHSISLCLRPIDRWAGRSSLTPLGEPPPVGDQPVPERAPRPPRGWWTADRAGFARNEPSPFAYRR